MDDETVRLLMIAAGVAAVSHSRIRQYGVACLVASFVASLLYIVESSIRRGLPPAKVSWLVMIFPYFIVCSAGVALLIGLPFLLSRRYTRKLGKVEH